MSLETELAVGVERQSGDAVRVNPTTLLRHAMALGSSGSGKTVFCKILVEECIRLGIPAICLDPQGDICSLALNADDPEALADKGINPDLARQFAENVDPVIFTPASTKGVAVCADPLQGDPGELSEGERMHAITGIASMLVSLLGYDLDSDEGDGLVAVFDSALNDRLAEGRYPQNLDQFSNWLQNLDEFGLEPYERFLDKKKIEQAIRRLARLDVGARKLMFHEGQPIDIDVLLGRNGDKTRVSVIYLNTLHSQEDKEFFVASLVDQLYRWMLKNPSTEPQALFYIDEVAPFIPPTRKPACKPGLGLLFKQARKYGIGCLMATQNPADVDYKAMAQFGSWAIGRITTRQDMKKVQPVVKSLDPTRVDEIMETLPSQQAGEFVLISPDNFERSLEIQSRWLFTKHETLDEDAIAALAAERGWHAKFQQKQPKQSPKKKREKRKAVTPAQEQIAEPDPQPERDENVKKLSAVISASAGEFAKAMKISESAARGRLKRLVDEGEAESYKEGRTMRFWAKASGLRPDLGLVGKVRAISPKIPRPDVFKVAQKLAQGKTLGLFGSEEELDNIELEHRLTLRLAFREKIPRPLLKRLFGANFDEHIDSIYLHPNSLKILVYDDTRGISFHDQPDQYASRIQDFDGLTTHDELKPGDLQLREEDWIGRQEDSIVLSRFRDQFDANAETLEPTFVPLWNLHFRKTARGAIRVVSVDALSGQPIDWP
ncbi:MAG: helicase HerA-like domain-containing protein [Verrucomicrobiota bacterium]